MNRLIAFMPAWWFMELGPSLLWKEGIGIGMVALIVWLWEKDRKSRIKTQLESDKRYSDIVHDLQAMIESNTKAITMLTASLTGKITNCPIPNDPVMHRWLSAWMEQSTQFQTKK